METLIEKFGRFIISRRADGSNVELRSSPSEVVFLAFDATIKRLVELHVLTFTSTLNAEDRSFVLETCKLATEVRGPSCMRVLEAGEEDKTVFFSTNLSDGELAEDYVDRRGALPPVTVFCLMLQFLEDLLSTPKFDQLLPHVSLANPLVTTLEDSFLQLRIVDYRPAASSADLLEVGSRRVVSECCRLLFLMLTGQSFEGQNPDQVPALTCLPTNLRTFLRTVLLDADQASPYLEKLRDDVREAYSSLVSNLQLRTSRRHIVVTEALQPRSQLKEMLLEQVPLAELLNGRFETVTGEEGCRHPFSIPAINLKTDQSVTVHLLPPSGIVPRDQYEAVPLQMWRFNPDRHPNILRSLSVWENPAWTFLTEEREPGFSLGRLMAERITLNPPEVLAILRQVRSGLDQAMECGVRSADLHPSNLMLKVGKGGPMQAREFERLMQKRIDAWPTFLVKLRTHMTMRSLYEPPLVELSDGTSDRDLHLAERELRHRAFLGLAVYLLTGERQAGNAPQFSEAVSEPLARFLHSSYDRTPAPSDFVDSFELHMGQAGPEGRGIAAIMAASAATGGDTEDAGAISDFDEDWSDSTEEAPAAPNYLLTGSATRKSFSYASVPQPRPSVPGRAGMLMWAGSAVLLLLMVRFVLFGGSHSDATEPLHNASPPAIAVKASTDPVVAARFSSAPDVASHASATAGKPAITTPPSAKPADEPAPAPVEKPASVTPPAAPVATPEPPPSAAPSPAKTATLTSPPPTPANAPDVIGPPSPPQAPRDSLETPITIKKAIVPSSKEVSDLKKEFSGTVQHVESKPSGVEVVDGALRGSR